ncbi:MAG: phosphoribosylglycinamide formyltransferase [Bacteroidota bacterium]
MNTTYKIAILASGSGTNAEAIMNRFSNHEYIAVSKVYSNNADAFVLERAKKFDIPTAVFNKQELHSEEFLNSLIEEGFDLIILAGFMWLVPAQIVSAFENRILNIHPALLPSYGGKGMYGHFVHEAVLGNKEKESGISIHYVNEKYDDGDIIFQAKCAVMESDTPDSLANRIHKLEHQHYPEVIEKICLQNN